MSSITSPGSSEPRPRLAIVIVTWNVRDYLEGCLRSLADARVHEWASIVVVDNASPDGSADMVEAAFPFVRLIRSAQNLGFTRGNNLALRTLDADYVLLLNPDTTVPAGALEALVAAIDADPTIGVVSPRQIGADGRVQFEAGVALPTVWNAFCDLALLSKVFPRSRFFSRRTMGWWDHLDDRDVDGVAGSAMLIRREALDRCGLLDETMFCAEDMDLCRRIRAAGWRIRYVGSVVITHFGGASVKRANAGRQRQIAYQSFWLYLRKHDGAVRAAAMSLMVGAVSAVGWCATGVVRALPGVPAKLADTADRFHDMATALIAWSVADKHAFRHELAAPPASVTRVSRGMAHSEERPR